MILEWIKYQEINPESCSTVVEQGWGFIYYIYIGYLKYAMPMDAFIRKWLYSSLFICAIFISYLTRGKIVSDCNVSRIVWTLR